MPAVASLAPALLLSLAGAVLPIDQGWPAQAPQVRYPKTVYEGAADEARLDGVEDGLLVCRTEIGRADDPARPDSEIQLTFVLGSAPATAIAARSEAGVVYTSLADVRLRKGQPVAVRFQESTPGTVGKGEAKGRYQGAFPLVVKGGALETCCRLVSGKVRQAAAAPHLRALGHLLDEIEPRLEADPVAPRWNYPADVGGKARAEGEAVASWLGLRALAPHFERMKALGRTWAKSRREAFLAKLPAFAVRGPVQISGLAVRVEAVVCDGRPVPRGSPPGKPSSCVFDLELTLAGEGAIALPAWTRPAPDLPATAVLEDGTEVALVAQDDAAADKVPGPNEPLRVRLVQDCRPKGGKCSLRGAAPLALRIEEQERVVLMSLR